MAKITFKLGVITSAVSKITFVMAEITLKCFKASSEVKINFVEV